MPDRTRRRIAELSLESLYRLRERLLPDLEALVARAAGVAELADVLASHERGWLLELFGPDRLPPRVRRANLAAFAADAVDRSAGPCGTVHAERVWSAWFDDPGSPLYCTIRRVTEPERRAGGQALRYRRAVCCLRDEVPGVARCRSCPKPGVEPAV